MQFKFLALASVALAAVQAMTVTPNAKEVYSRIDQATDASKKTEEYLQGMKKFGYLFRNAQVRRAPPENNRLHQTEAHKFHRKVSRALRESFSSALNSTSSSPRPFRPRLLPPTPRLSQSP